ncbi:hypothetical protein [Fumia xinanensis]|uniref:Uncharacterized protein n=1 Tax=Fumia xinanensis TaxID=2763659 RepID=A0A926I7T2_9FIRM|nr:hypothetical protein [Fumia xinanensis]MBC8560264.1 hypothetical protein [Fumia xinanensis]
MISIAAPPLPDDWLWKICPYFYSIPLFGGSWQIFLETNAEFFKNKSNTLFLAGITGRKGAKIQMYQRKSVKFAQNRKI